MLLAVRVLLLLVEGGRVFVLLVEGGRVFVLPGVGRVLGGRGVLVLAVVGLLKAGMLGEGIVLLEVRVLLVVGLEIRELILLEEE